MNENVKEIRWCSNHAGGNIFFRIVDGELTYAARAGTNSRYTHSITEHPNWNHAQDCLESLYYDDKERFLSVVKLLREDSRGYQAAQRVKLDCVGKIQSQLDKELAFWGKI